MEPMTILLAAYLLFNIIAFFSFLADKRKARNNAWRTPEIRLLLLSLLGPFGAYAAMVSFRHKTRKERFFLVPIFLVVHIVAIAYLIYAGELSFPYVTG